VDADEYRELAHRWGEALAYPEIEGEGKENGSPTPAAASRLTPPLMEGSRMLWLLKDPPLALAIERPPLALAIVRPPLALAIVRPSLALAIERSSSCSGKRSKVEREDVL